MLYKQNAIPVQLNANAVRNVTDTLGPDKFVQLDINTVVGCSHLLHGEFLDLADSTRSTLLE